MELMTTNMDLGLGLPDLKAKASKEEKIDKWWEVKRFHNVKRGATPLVERFKRVHGFDHEYGCRVLKAYRQFMELKSVMNDMLGQKLEPSIPVALMWDQHLVDNLNYTDDCFFLFGKVIGNDPDSCLDIKATLDRIQTTKIALEARYGANLDEDLWFYDEINEIENAEKLGSSAQPGRLPVAGVPSGTIPVGMDSSMGASPASQPTLGYGDEMDAEYDSSRDDINDVVLDESNYFGRKKDQVHEVEDDLQWSSKRSQRSQYSEHSPHRSRSTPRQNTPRLKASSEKSRSTVQSEKDLTPAESARERKHRLSRKIKNTKKTLSPPETPASTRSSRDPITLFIRNEEAGDETYFSMRSKSALKIVFSVYAQRNGFQKDSLKFYYNNQRLTGYETPHNLGIEDRECIDVIVGKQRK